VSPVADCPRGCSCRGLPPLPAPEGSPLTPRQLEVLASEANQRVRRRLIAHWTADALPCPLCGAEVGRPCVNRRSGYTAVTTHSRRVRDRLARFPVSG
jgi:hypothetical protein